MGTGNTSRIWIIGGALGACALVAIAWFFLISPKNNETARLRDDANSASDRLITLQRRLSELRKQNADLPRYQAKLASDRQALPTTSGLSSFLRDLQTTGDKTGVSVGTLSVNAPLQVAAAGTHVQALPVSLTADGDVAKLNQFLDQLQQGQPRAVLITSASVSAKEASSTLNLSFEVFVASDGQASPSTSPSAAPSASPSAGTTN